jgi:hypothetical protein
MLGAREKIDAINFDQITSIQIGKGVFSSTVKLRAYGYQEDIESIQKDKAEKIVEYTRNAIADISKGKVAEQGSPVPQQQTPSLADELLKLAKLKEQGYCQKQSLHK